MLAAIGAASSIFEALKSLTSSGSPPSKVTTGFVPGATASFGLASTTGAGGAGAVSTAAQSNGKLSPDTLSALLAAQDQPPTAATSKSKADALNDLFSLLDGDGSGKISKAEFENALGAGGTNVAAADSVFGKLDQNGDGSVSAEELAAALKDAGRHHDRGRDHAAGSKDANGSHADALRQALDGISGATAANGAGSTVASSFADGSSVTPTSATASAASIMATSSYQYVEQAIQRETQAHAASTAASISVSA